MRLTETKKNTEALLDWRFHKVLCGRRIETRHQEKSSLGPVHDAVAWPGHEAFLTAYNSAQH